MKKSIVAGTLCAVAFAVPAVAAQPSHPTHPAHGGNSPSKGSRNCNARNRGYYATGTLVSGSLTAGTTAGHFDGTLAVTVSRADHKAGTGSQTYTLTNARVHFGKGVSSTTIAAGDRVKVHGKITALPHGCDTTGFTPAITVHDVTIKAPKKAH